MLFKKSYNNRKRKQAGTWHKTLCQVIPTYLTRKRKHFGRSPKSTVHSPCSVHAHTH